MHRPRLLSAVVVLALLPITAPGLGDAQEAWIDRLDGPAGMSDAGYAAAVAADGSVYVAGSIFEQVGSNLFAPRFMTIRYDASGSRTWTRTYAGTFASGSAVARHVAIDPAGDVVVAGSTNQGNDWAVVKYDAAGNELWQRVYEADSTFLTQPDDMAVDTDGNVYLVGYVGDSLNPGAGALVKFTAAGDEAWARRYYGPTFDGAFFEGVAVDDDGNAYAVGAAVVPGRASEFAVVKYDATGGQQWVTTDGSIGQFTHDRAADVAIAPNGDVVAAGLFGSNAVTGIDLATIRIAPDGTPAWRRLYAGPAGLSDYASEVAIDSTGAAIVVGSSGSAPNDTDALTLKYDATGTLQWERRVAGDEIHADYASGVAIDAVDHVYVTGSYDPIGGERFFTVRYDAGGEVGWFMDYAGPLGGGSRAYDVAVGADGVVSVTGESPGQATGFDIATISYRQSAPVAGDVTGDGGVTLDDLLVVLSDWGACPDCGACPADLDGDCIVGVADLLLVLSHWS